jgi:hypothetical protein
MLEVLLGRETVTVPFLALVVVSSDAVVNVSPELTVY